MQTGIKIFSSDHELPSPSSNSIKSYSEDIVFIWQKQVRTVYHPLEWKLSTSGESSFLSGSQLGQICNNHFTFALACNEWLRTLELLGKSQCKPVRVGCFITQLRSIRSLLNLTYGQWPTFSYNSNLDTEECSNNFGSNYVELELVIVLFDFI